MRLLASGIVLGLLFLSGCKGKGNRLSAGDSLSFSVDTAEIKAMDSMALQQRRTDSELVKKANARPGYNVGLERAELRTPAGWRRTDTLIGNIRAALLDTASERLRFRTSVSLVSDSLHQLSLDKYVRGAIGGFVQYVPRFSLIGQGRRVIGGRSSRWLHYSQDADGTDLENICYFIPDSGMVYILTCSALKGRLLQSRPAFESVIGSFTVRRGSAPPPRR
ncbi:MAG TPA: hypothetical protein VN616_05220 [Puia sp.]|nr:hypothetical protein [Puia sp.]